MRESIDSIGELFDLQSFNRNIEFGNYFSTNGIKLCVLFNNVKPIDVSPNVRIVGDPNAAPAFKHNQLERVLFILSHFIDFILDEDV